MMPPMRNVSTSRVHAGCRSVCSPRPPVPPPIDTSARLAPAQAEHVHEGLPDHFEQEGPSLSAPTSRPTRRGSSTTIPPTARASNLRSPTRSPRSSGMPKEDVKWVRVPFNAAIAPGPKTFDANLNEFSITDERKQAVDFSSPYYDVTQAVVTVKSSPAAGVTTLDGLKGLKLGAQVGTTSYTAAKALDPAVAVFNNNDDAKAALSNGQIDGLVLDLPTAFAVQAELTDGVIVGQLPAGTEACRAVRDRAGQGQPAHGVRVQGRRRTRHQRRPSPTAEGVARQRRKRAGAFVTTAAIDRVAYRQARARRSTLIALGSTVVFAAVLLARGDVVTGLAAGTGLVLQPARRLGEPACAVGRAVAERPGARGLPGADPDRRTRAGRGADAARSGVVSVAGVGNRVCRSVPGPAPADLPVPRRVRPAGAATVGRSERTRCCWAVSRWC